jgi:hypothetical protein
VEALAAASFWRLTQPPLQRQRFAHRVYWRFTIEPDGKRKRPLMEQHRESIRATRAGLIGCAQQ